MEEIKLQSIYDNPFTYFTEQIDKTELNILQNHLTNIIPHYKELEDKLFEYISQIPLIEEPQRKRFKKELLKLLKERFDSNDYIQSSHLEFQIKLEMLFNQYMANVFDCSVELLTFCENYSNKSSLNVKTFFDYLQSLKESALSAYIKESMQLNYSLPRFLLSNYSKLIKQKINTLWRMNNIHSYNANWKLDGNASYNFLYKEYRDFFDGKSNLFDEKYLDKATLALLFQALIFSNGDRLKYNSNIKLLLQNARKYLDLMGFKRDVHSSMVGTCYDFIQKNFQTEIDAKLSTVFSELSSRIGLSQDGNVNEKMMYIIFCCSCVMNNVVLPVNESKIKAAFVSTMKCSSKERQFLLNFLTKYDSFIQSVSSKCVYINGLIEKYVLSDLVKSYTKVLYDQQNTFKVHFSYQRIIDMLNQSCKSKESNEAREEEYFFSPLNEIDQDQFSMYFSQFKESIHEKDKEKAKDNDNVSQSKVYTKTKSIFNKLTKEVTKHIPINKPLMKHKFLNILYPTDPLCVSIHICICISGIFLHDNAPCLNDSSIWFNLIKKNENVDYYVYDWQNDDNLVKSGSNIVKDFISFVKSSNGPEFSQVKDNKRTAKKFGKLLAYIIASRAVFKFHTISLMGFALGCNVIKYCLKELNKINMNIDVSDIIYNVIFFGGATTLNQKHKELFAGVSGSVYNFYSRCDVKLSFYYSENAIGCNEIQFTQESNSDKKDNENEETAYPNIVNFDLTSSKYKQATYGIRLNKLLANIKIL